MSGEQVAKREMPKYSCHKEVWALKIGAVERHQDGSATITPEDNRYAPFRTETQWGVRFRGDVNDLGYYVLYKDGYKSWSPSEAFEEGYSLIG